MPRLALLLDECVDYRLVAGLRSRGYDVVAVVDLDSRGLTDETQLVQATNAGRLLISHNQVDFRRLHTAFLRDDRAHAGIALLPQIVPYALLEVRAMLLLDWVSSTDSTRSRLFTWSELQQHVIHGLRLPGWDEQVIRQAMAWDRPGS